MATHFPDEYGEIIRTGRLAPVVLFTGEEQLLAEECISLIVQHSVEESMRDFNLDVLDGTRVTMQDVLAHAGSFPMMSERRVVIVQRFERLISNDKGRELFQAYLALPSVSTRMVLTVEKADFRKKPFSDIKKQFDVVDCKPLPERQIPGWIQGRARKMGKTIDEEGASLLQSYAGNSLHPLLRELEKLAAFVGQRDGITSDDVAQAVGATRGYTFFDLQDSVGKRDFRQSASIVRRMMLSGDQGPLIIATLTKYFALLMNLRECLSRRMTQPSIVEKLGVHPYRVKLLMPVAKKYTAEEIAEAFHALRDADRRLKTSDADRGAEMDLMLHRIIRSGMTTSPGSDRHE